MDIHVVVSATTALDLISLGEELQQENPSEHKYRKTGRTRSAQIHQTLHRQVSQPARREGSPVLARALPLARSNYIYRKTQTSPRPESFKSPISATFSHGPLVLSNSFAQAARREIMGLEPHFEEPNNTEN